MVPSPCSEEKERELKSLRTRIRLHRVLRDVRKQHRKEKRQFEEKQDGEYNLAPSTLTPTNVGQGGLPGEEPEKKGEEERKSEPGQEEGATEADNNLPNHSLLRFPDEKGPEQELEQAEEDQEEEEQQREQQQKQQGDCIDLHSGQGDEKRPDLGGLARESSQEEASELSERQQIEAVDHSASSSEEEEKEDQQQQEKEDVAVDGDTVLPSVVEPSVDLPSVAPGGSVRAGTTHLTVDEKHARDATATPPHPSEFTCFVTDFDVSQLLIGPHLSSESKETPKKQNPIYHRGVLSLLIDAMTDSVELSSPGTLPVLSKRIERKERNQRSSPPTPSPSDHLNRVSPGPSPSPTPASPNHQSLPPPVPSNSHLRSSTSGTAIREHPNQIAHSSSFTRPKTAHGFPIHNGMPGEGQPQPRLAGEGPSVQSLTRMGSSFNDTPTVFIDQSGQGERGAYHGHSYGEESYQERGSPYNHPYAISHGNGGWKNDRYGVAVPSPMGQSGGFNPFSQQQQQQQHNFSNPSSLPVHEWSVDHVCSWLNSLGGSMITYGEIFREQHVDGAALIGFSQMMPLSTHRSRYENENAFQLMDLTFSRLGIVAFGDQLKLLNAIHSLCNGANNGTLDPIMDQRQSQASTTNRRLSLSSQRSDPFGGGSIHPTAGSVSRRQSMSRMSALNVDFNGDHPPLQATMLETHSQMLQPPLSGVHDEWGAHTSEDEHAAVVVQSHYRGYKTRKHVEVLRRKKLERKQTLQRLQQMEQKLAGMNMQAMGMNVVGMGNPFEMVHQQQGTTTPPGHVSWQGAYASPQHSESSRRSKKKHRRHSRHKKHHRNRRYDYSDSESFSDSETSGSNSSGSDERRPSSRRHDRASSHSSRPETPIVGRTGSSFGSLVSTVRSLKSRVRGGPANDDDMSAVKQIYRITFMVTEMPFTAEQPCSPQLVVFKACDDGEHQEVFKTEMRRYEVSPEFDKLFDIASDKLASAYTVVLYDIEEDALELSQQSYIGMLTLSAEDVIHAAETDEKWDDMGIMYLRPEERSGAAGRLKMKADRIDCSCPIHGK